MDGLHKKSPQANPAPNEVLMSPYPSVADSLSVRENATAQKDGVQKTVWLTRIKDFPMKVNFVELAHLAKKDREQLFQRESVDISGLTRQVSPIIEAVRTRGDEAVQEYTRIFDGVDKETSGFRVPFSEMDRAVEELPSDLRIAMEISIANIRAFHECQLPASTWEIEIMPGVSAGEKLVPLASVGLYVPRGKGSFPSMMMMAGVPAKVAGVERIVVVTPPDRDGKADLATLAAARLIGLEEVYAVGGVQAIAALAFGTQTMPRVDKIVGPGSGYVLAAKQLLSYLIDTGLPAGPSEAIVLADDSVDVVIAVTDLLIEAEHGPDSSAYLVTPDPSFAHAAVETIPVLVERLPEPRRDYCRTVLSSNGGIVLAAGLEDAIDFINGFAPEHLQLLVRNPEEVLEKIRFAGEVLLGPWTPGTLANYSLGPNAILPTSRFARTASALSVRDFTRRMSFSRVTAEGFRHLAPHTVRLADYEGFPAHAAALRYRMGMDITKQ